jgi:hypothetical protein
VAGLGQADEILAGFDAAHVEDEGLREAIGGPESGHLGGRWRSETGRGRQGDDDRGATEAGFDAVGGELGVGDE